MEYHMPSSYSLFPTRYVPSFIGFSSSSRPHIDFIFFLKRIRTRVNEIPAYTSIILGIGVCVIVSIPIFTLVLVLALRLLGSNLFETKTILELAWIGVVGAQGSIVSMLIRIRRIGTIKDNTSFSLLLNATLKPFIGLSLAHLSYFLLNSGFLIPIAEGGNPFHYAIIFAFIVGFTERISPDIQLSEKYMEKIKDNNLEQISISDKKTLHNKE